MLYRVIRPLLFHLDPERVHTQVLGCLAIAEWVLAHRRRARPPWTHPMLAQLVWDLPFANPVGLAAGFDKDGRAPHVWSWLGFGFAELGTITADPQPGNPRPRLFRLARDRAVINRFGFNSDGAAAVARRLARLSRHVTPPFPVGINIGKSRLTPVEQAAADYARSLRQLFPFAAYVAVNVSSPNTPGLRDLQAEEHLSTLLATLAVENRTAARACAQPPRPLLLKIAPDLSDEALASIVAIARRHQVDGFIATNTTISRSGLATPSPEAGGLSGAPLRARATEVIRTLYRLAGPDLPIIGIGGVFSADDAYDKIRAGATLVQIYTGMIFEGPSLPRRINHGLVALLRRDGFTHLREAIGTA